MRAAHGTCAATYPITEYDRATLGTARSLPSARLARPPVDHQPEVQIRPSTFSNLDESLKSQPGCVCRFDMMLACPLTLCCCAGERKGLQRRCAGALASPGRSSWPGRVPEDLVWCPPPSVHHPEPDASRGRERRCTGFWPVPGRSGHEPLAAISLVSQGPMTVTSGA